MDAPFLRSSGSSGAAAHLLAHLQHLLAVGERHRFPLARVLLPPPLNGGLVRRIVLVGADRLEADILSLKYDSSIFRQSSNSVSDIIIGGFRRFSAEGACSAVCYCLSRFRVRQNFQCKSLLCMWFTAEPSQFSVGQTAPSLTCSIMEKPSTGLDDCLRLLLSCLRKRMSVLEQFEYVVDVWVLCQDPLARLGLHLVHEAARRTAEIGWLSP